MAGATWNCSRFGASSVYTIQPCTMSLHEHAMWSSLSVSANQSIRVQAGYQVTELTGLTKLTSSAANSKPHWFTTSFPVQPLPYLVTPGFRKLSASNEQFFAGAQTVVSLLQTTQIKQGVSFIAANKVYSSTNKTTIVWIETELFLSFGVDASHVYVRALALLRLLLQSR